MGPWFGNYYHWLIYSLPRIITINESVFKGPLILPAWMPGSDHIQASLALLGHEIKTLQRVSLLVTSYDRLIAADGGFSSPNLFSKLRNTIVNNVNAAGGSYI